ncbi:transcriptional regulator, LysR family protein [Parvularcula bermudensis HTCC2503]|uniref:Transcriptional regulator, LysR family protein n=1 Tax=Parvularcula bermudensis (strain ATCC BAA-594 / HTCC2503 / KCTC 12087) TaxID=314260 RepID=E0THI8_PARBH|nr:LysR family transcriptional regulator [Parvularcula bermudensis]ADM09284.1 transcriptional regulator, LysR family protein [Parvularcula bermudensis HTCC2503]
MLENIPSLQALRAFVSVAELGGVRSAARELHVSEAALSQHLRRLEERLGKRLFEKTGRGLRLTELGRRYLQMLSEPLAEISRATELVSDSRSVKPISVTLAPTLATLWLIPQLAQLEADLPGVDIKIISSTALLDLGRHDIDIAIRQLPNHALTPDTEVLFPEAAFPVCTPALLDRVECSDGSAELVQKARLLHNASHPKEWADWSAAIGGIDKLSSNHHWMEDSAMVLEAAAHSYGVAIGRRPLVDNYLATKRLIAPFGTDYPTNWSYVLIRGQAGAKPDRTDRLIVWFRRQVKTRNSQ